MAYLWNYVYYDDTLVSPIWEGDYPRFIARANPYPPIIIDSGDFKGVYFCVVEQYGWHNPSYRLHIWKWDWETGLLWPNLSGPILSLEGGAGLVLTDRPLSFISPDELRAFLVSTEGHFLDITPIIEAQSWGYPTYLGKVETFPLANEPSVGYAGGTTFAYVTGSNLNVRIFSWNGSFPSLTLPRYRIPFQNASDPQHRLILFSRNQQGISQEAPPVLVNPDGTTRTTTDGLDLPDSMKTGTFTAALSPHPSGYDFFIWDIDEWTLQSAFDLRVMNWVEDETTWIYLKQATLQGINVPPEINLLTGSRRTLKSISAQNLGALLATRTKDFDVSYSSSSTSVQDALVLADMALGKFILCALTPIGTETFRVGNFFPLQFVEAVISPPTFHNKRGCWYATVIYQNAQTSTIKIAFLQIIHPQFYSKYFASVPAIVSITSDDKFLTFVAKTTPRFPNQHWSLAIVATQDSNLKEIVASTKERVTRWEKWETSNDGTNWTELPEGSYIDRQKWVRLKVPKSIVEWKKDTFTARNPNKVWRLVFISEPVVQ